MTIKWVGCSPSNFKVGREGNAPSVVILHWMAGRLASCDATFQDGRRQASAHYGIEDSIIHQYVKEEDTSFNCGVLEWNTKSISIEHSGGPDLPISEETYRTSIDLITDICRRHNLTADCIKKHNDYKATQCPGDLNVERIKNEVRTRLAQPINPDQVKIDLGEPWGVQEVQAIKSMLKDAATGLTAAQEKGKVLDGFISKWVAEWNLPTGSNLVEVEGEMAKLLLLEDKVAEYRNAIEGCVGTFETDKALLDALHAVRTDVQAKSDEIAKLQKKLEEAKTPVGYSFVKTWDIYSLRFKLYKKVR